MHFKDKKNVLSSLTFLSEYHMLHAKLFMLVKSYTRNNGNMKILFKDVKISGGFTSLWFLFACLQSFLESY